MQCVSSVVSLSIICLTFKSIWIRAFIFETLPLRLDTSRPGFSRDNILQLGSTSDANIYRLVLEQNSTRNSYSIHLSNSRETALGVKLYRFGGSTVEDHMEANPELTSRDDALRFLTPTFDDFGKGKVYYGDGTIGESLQFFALGDDKSSLVSLKKNNEEHVHDSLLQNRRVIASIEAVKDPIEEKEFEIRVSIELKNLSVHEDSRRRGIGKALTKAVQDYARSEVLVLKEQKNKKVEGLVHLLVEAKNAGAVRLYEESGFRRIGIGKDPLCKMTWSIDES